MIEQDEKPVRVKVETSRLTWVGVVLLVLLVGSCVFGGEGAWAHPGGLAADGCHREKATGTRHCHPERAGGAAAPLPRASERSTPAPVQAFASPFANAPSIAEQEEIAGLLARIDPADRAMVVQLLRRLAR